MALLPSLLMAQAMAGEPSLAEAPAPQPVDSAESDWTMESVRAGLEEALPELLAQASRDCGVGLVRTQAEDSSVLAVKAPLGKARCVDSSLASHTIVFLEPDRDWELKAVCAVSAVPAPEFSRPFDLAQYKTASFRCTFPPFEN